MKPLILVLLFSVVAQAQNIADVARQERQRQAALKNVKVLTMDDIHPAEAATAEKPAAPTEAKSAAPAVKPAEAATPPAAETPKVDPVQKWNEDVAKLRAIIRELQDREMTQQLTLNDLTNQFYSPVTDPQTMDQAQKARISAQNDLAETQKSLKTAQDDLSQMEKAGPPKP